MNLETIIGLEIHVQLKTKSKMFCGCANDGESKPANTTICEVCLGHPGSLPVPNKLALEWAIKIALALSCKINNLQYFDRKNYYYPDLPKGYQISQFPKPIGESGYLFVKSNLEDKLKIGIERVHIEEDAAKNIHDDSGVILVDYNRGGTPLTEIVTCPDFRSPTDVKIFLQELRLIVRYLGVSDADMEKGHLRCDANISLRPKEDSKLYPKTELKNMNSFKAVERALEYEVMRQTKLWIANTPPTVQATRGWNDAEQVTVEQRIKEESHDYRYFPEPDIPSLKFSTSDIDIDRLKSGITELPAAKRIRMREEYGIKSADINVLVEDIALAEYFERTASEVREWLASSGEDVNEVQTQKLTKLVADWLLNKLGRLMVERKLAWVDINITPENFAEFISLLTQGKINSKIGQEVLLKMFETGSDPSDIVKEFSLEQVDSEDEILEIIKSVFDNNPDNVAEYKSGKETLLKFFVGQVMKESRGTANPQLVEKILKKELKK